MHTANTQVVFEQSGIAICGCRLRLSSKVYRRMVELGYSLLSGRVFTTIGSGNQRVDRLLGYC